MSVHIDDSAVASLTRSNGDVDRHVRRIAQTTYVISQRLVPTAGQADDPYARGPLKQSGTVKRGPGPSVWDVEYTSNHAIYLELGTRYMRAEPYLRPALLAAVRAHD